MSCLTAAHLAVMESSAQECHKMLAETGSRDGMESLCLAWRATTEGSLFAAACNTVVLILSYCTILGMAQGHALCS